MGMKTMQRGEIWLVNLDSTIGSEIRKTRPAVIISSDLVGILPVKVIVPFTEWKEHYAQAPWMVKIDPDVQNGLSKPSAADALQIRSAQSRCCLPS
jgi:mRNA interferase MazF